MYNSDYFLLYVTMLAGQVLHQSYIASPLIAHLSLLRRTRITNDAFELQLTLKEISSM